MLAGSSNTPTDAGLAALPVADLLGSVEDLVARIRLCFGIDRADFARELQPLVHRYACYVHRLPATADNYFSAPGGLLRLGLEVGFFSLQGTDAHIFSGRSTISVRRQLEPRWRLATFIGGLCCELHRVLSHVIVTDAHGDEWPAYLQPLSTWLGGRGTERYFVRWRPDATETRALGILALPHVVPPDTLQFLNEDNTIIVPHLLASIGGMPVVRDHNVLDSLVRRSLALVIDRNLQAHADRNGAPRFGSHLERYLVDALRRLVASHSAWMPNREKSRVWFGRDGLFLVWPQAGGDMQALLEADQLPGIPKAAQTLLEVLLGAGVFEAQAGQHPTWTILPPGARAPVEAVKLASPAILLAGQAAQPEAIDASLVSPPDAPLSDRSGKMIAPTTPPGTQLSLIDQADEAEWPDAPAAAALPRQPAAPARDAKRPNPLPPSPAVPPTFRLNAPLRLNPAVRDALASVVHTLNGPGATAAACAAADGLFVPLQELERHGIQPALAMRALADVSMLVHAQRSRPPAVSRDFRGEMTPGLVIDPRCVDGFDLAAFNLPETQGE